jgi:hypothetical protein
MSTAIHSKQNMSILIERMCEYRSMKLANWARVNGVHPQTTYRWSGFCARLYGNQGARNRATRAVTCANRPPRPTGVEES